MARAALLYEPCTARGVKWGPLYIFDILAATNSTSTSFWLKDESLEDSANLPDPDIIAAEIVEDLQAALAQFAEIASDLKK